MVAANADWVASQDSGRTYGRRLDHSGRSFSAQSGAIARIDCSTVVAADSPPTQGPAGSTRHWLGRPRTARCRGLAWQRQAAGPAVAHCSDAGPPFRKWRQESDSLVAEPAVS